ncbi:MAG TPA: hypothetical protein VHE30_18265 [Polyangiaceae bacterium]|nr:hypothetical protein [Polyangiaceae bacterium]
MMHRPLFVLLCALCLSVVSCGTKLSAPTANIVIGLAALGDIQTGTEVALDGSTSTDPNGEPLAYRWRLTRIPPGSRAVVSDTAAMTTWFVPDLAGIYEIELVVSDGSLTSVPSTTTITATGCANDVPTLSYVSASTRSPNSGERVSLSATLGSSDLRPVGSGDGNGAVTDGGTPSGDAGTAPPPVTAGCTPHVTYHWSLLSVPSGSTAALSGETAQAPWFLADVPGDYVAELYVENDRGDRSEAKTVTVTAGVCGSRAPETTPIVATNDTPSVGDAVGFSTVVSDADDGASCLSERYTYAWTVSALPPGSLAALNDPTAESPSLVIDRPGPYAVTVVVTDSEGHASDAKTLELTVGDCGTRPPSISSVTASPASPGTDVPVSLTATVKDDDTGSACGEPAVYALTWAFASVPGGSHAALSGIHQDTPWFTPDVPGKYVVSVVATDARGLTSAPETLDVTASSCGAAAPSATITASPASGSVGAGVSLAATVTDSDTATSCGRTETFTYAWTFQSVPPGSVATLASTDSPVSGFVPDLSGTYGVALVVTDSEGHASARATKNVNVANVTTSTCGTHAPVPRLSAITGGACSVPTTCGTTTSTPAAGSSPNATAPGYTVRLNGHGSVKLDASGTTDADDVAPCNAKETLSYSWSILTAPVGSRATWSIGTGSTTTLVAPTFDPDVPGTYQVGLVVSDGTNQSSLLVVQIEL